MGVFRIFNTTTGNISRKISHTNHTLANSIMNATENELKGISPFTLLKLINIGCELAITALQNKMAITALQNKNRFSF